MRTIHRIRFAVAVVASMLIAMMAAPAIGVAAEPTVNLGTTASFAILAGTTITNTGPTTVTGDIGLYPGTAITGEAQITRNGARHVNDAVAAQAKTDLVTAYNDAAGRVVTANEPVDLGGLTLGPGVYASGGVLSITGTLTLDAQGDPDAVFIFQSTATLITASDSHVELINSARFCRVFWVVPSSATLGTNSAFVGHIFALTDIHAQTGATVEGQLLARNGEVTLDTNTITNEICAASRVINITKTASPTALTGPGSVTYTYRVTNPGSVALENVVVTDDKVSPVTYVSGDNGNDLLEPGETWIYTATAQITATTRNTATVTGNAVGAAAQTATDTAVVTVVVRGGLLPDTGTPWYDVLLAGLALILLGAVGWVTTRIHA